MGCNISHPEKSVFLEFQEFSEQIVNSLFTSSGCKIPECPQPCTEIKVHSELTYLLQAWPISGIQINLDPKVKIVTHRVVYGMFELIVDVGSSLGLWIGLSFLGIYDQMLEQCYWIKTACSGAVSKV